ncbi:MAG: S9 family peptidase, partial [Alkalimonas sp.]|nr:S9 family peptidase [Alkalimonas sp.]
MTLKFASSLLSLLVVSAMAQAEQDPYLWLEDVHGERAMEWVEQQNKHAKQQLAQSELYQQMFDQTLEVLDSDDRIDFPSRQGDYLYNFWRDANNQRGLYRRTTVESYATGDPEWQVVLDIDALAAAEDENWVYKGMSCLYPDYQRCLVNLSRGGADATVVREFDKSTMSFVEDGFTLPEAKSRVGWIDQDSLYVATDFGEGSLTTSGYPREVRVWQRGADL